MCLSNAGIIPTGLSVYFKSRFLPAICTQTPGRADESILKLGGLVIICYSINKLVRKKSPVYSIYIEVSGFVNLISNKPSTST